MPWLPPRLKRLLAGGRRITIDGNTLDPTLQLMLAAQRLSGTGGLGAADDVGVARALMRNSHVAMGTDVEVQTSGLTIPGPDSPLPARHYRPALATGLLPGRPERRRRGPSTAFSAATRPSGVALLTSMLFPSTSPAAKMWGTFVAPNASTVTSPRAVATPPAASTRSALPGQPTAKNAASTSTVLDSSPTWYRTRTPGWSASSLCTSALVMTAMPRPRKACSSATEMSISAPPVPHEPRGTSQRAHRCRAAVKGGAADPPPLDERDLCAQLGGG
jgi:hypothetical protein